MRATVVYLLAAPWFFTANAFSGIGSQQLSSATGQRPQSATARFLAAEEAEDADIVAKRITVKGDVQGGYYRSCVKNEVSDLRGIKKQRLG